MKQLVKYISLICCLCLVFSALTGCGKKTDKSAVHYDVNEEVAAEETSDSIAQNDNFTMGWNKDRCAVTLTSKKDGRVWSTLPNDYLKSSTTDDIAMQDFLNSPIAIRHKIEGNEKDAMAATSAIQGGRVGSKLIDNGISVTYYFDEFLISIQVDYYLDGDGVKISVDPKKIQEGGDEQVLTVSIAPFMCAVKNTKAGSKDSYLVVPSGSGALMYSDVRSDDLAREFSGDIYGEDLAVDFYTKPANTTPVSMPFFGAKAGNDALCAIIEQGAEACVLNAQAGNSSIGYSSVYPMVNLRGYENIYLPGTHRIQRGENLVDMAPIVIGYYPLSGKDANYTGIAQRYQKYLVDQKGMTKSGQNKLLSVKLLGSYLADDLFLGLPTQKAKALTTYQDATNILTELKTTTDGSMIADLYGYGEGGVDGAKVAGNYKLTGVVGNKKALTDFLSFTKGAGIDTFFNFDLIYYNKSGGGFSVSRNAAINLVQIPAATRQIWRSTRGRLESADGGVTGVLLSRAKIGTAADKAVKLTDKYGISGLAFSSLGSSAYSDYRYAQNSVKNKMAEDVKNIISNVQKSKKSVLVDRAFSYAAAAADVLIECPTVSNQERCFDTDLPLYQIVFQGYKANYGTSINLSVDRRTQFLKAMETGSGLSFTLDSNYDIDLRKQYDPVYYATKYSDNKDYIKECVNEASTYLKSVAGAAIRSHEMLAKNVTKTTFDNNVTVYVNFNDSQVSTEAGTIAPNSFIVK